MSLTGEQNLSPCSPKEPDTRIMYHCTLQDKPTLVIVLDTDILTLSLISQFDTQFVNVSKIQDYNGNAVAVMLSAMFVLAGCDTVSYFYRKSKKAILQQVLKQEVLVVELVLDLKQI